LSCRLTQTQLAGAVADRAEITKAEAKRVLDALEDVVLDEIANAEKVKIERWIYTQLQSLRAIGFDDVDCYWKWLEMALLIGVKPPRDAPAR
jgi:tRNA A37 N6-isopentenylltransferase MiaA